MKREESKNFRKHERCPQCHRKGLYTRRHLSRLEYVVKRCKYCHYESEPISLVPEKTQAEEAAELRQMARELRELLDAFMLKWRIPYGDNLSRLPPADRYVPGTVPELPCRYSDSEKHAALRL